MAELVIEATMSDEEMDNLATQKAEKSYLKLIAPSDEEDGDGAKPQTKRSKNKK